MNTTDFDRLLADHDPSVAALARDARRLILDMLPDAVETVEGGDAGFGVAPGYAGLVFVLTPHTDRVNLGISGGASLPDPHRLMEGSGRVHRHVKLRAPADLARPELRALLEAAVAAKS